MKMLVAGFAVGVLFATTIATTRASFMDESNCLRGTSGIAFDMSDAINNVDSRLVACVNYLQTKQIDNHNELAQAIRTLEVNLSTLEVKISTLENSVEDLENR